jgi:hypothetical protein
MARQFFTVLEAFDVPQEALQALLDVLRTRRNGDGGA